MQFCCKAMILRWPEVVQNFADNKDFNEVRENVEPYYCTSDRSTAKVDFVIDTGSVVFSIEEKAETNLQAKSLKAYWAVHFANELPHEQFSQSEDSGNLFLKI